MHKISHLLKKVILNERVILFIIILNAIIIFLMESGVQNIIISILDLLCTLFFLIEMIYKNLHFGPKKYWSNPWETMDGILVILSLPAIISFIFSLEIGDLSFLLILRVLRILRMFRLTRVFPDFDIIMHNFYMALKKSNAFFLIIFIFITVFALIDSSLFKTAAPQYFQTPLDAIYSTFRLFTIEGWYEIPDAVAEGMNNRIWVHLVRLFFSAQLFIGGIIGLSLINSIFVDAMVSDNNDDLQKEVRELKTMLQQIQKKLDNK